MLRRPPHKRLLMFTFMVLVTIWPTAQTSVMAQSGTSQDLTEIIVRLTPKGWEIFDKVKQFTPENLYEQINGRAEFFIAYDIIRMTFASFSNSADKQKFIDLSIYDMGNPTNAFGVFSTERSQGESSLELGRDSYRSDANYYIWKGQYYIKIIASEASGQLQGIGMELARRVTDFLVDSGEAVWGLTTLPLKDRVPEPVQYFKVDAMGLDFMRNTYTARYRKFDTLVTVFLSRQKSPDSALSAMDQYEEYAKKYGKGIDHMKIDDVKFVSCNMGKNYDVIFQKGPLMGGVLSVKEQSLALRVASELWRQLP